MTAREMSDRIDVLLNSYLIQHAFGNPQGDLDITLNEYEKSLYLTNAQYEIIKSYYAGKPTFFNTGEAFETNEEVRRILNKLLKTVTYTSLSTSSKNTNQNGNDIVLISNEFNDSFYTIPNDVWYIVYEDVILIDDGSDEVPCNTFPAIEVLPVKHDELRKFLSNPFKRPNHRKVFRLDMDNNSVELVSSYPIDTYKIRYVSKPNPIITADLPDDVSIEGVNTYTDCLLNTVIHDLIVNVAVQLAINTKRLGQTEEQAQQK